MGTSGGLGVKPGSIVVTEKALNPLLQVVILLQFVDFNRNPLFRHSKTPN